MGYYYVALISRSQAFLLERRMKNEGIMCELTYMPRDIIIDLCNLGVRFHESVLPMALTVIKRSGLPGCKVYKEVISPDSARYLQLNM